MIPFLQEGWDLVPKEGDAWFEISKMENDGDTIVEHVATGRRMTYREYLKEIERASDE